MTTVSATTIRDRVGDLILQTFGTGPYGNLTPSASGGVVTFPSGYRIVYAIGDGQAKIVQLQQGVDVPASDNDEVHAVIVDDEITAIEAAASTPAGNQKLGTATGTPVDTFTQDDRAGGIVRPAVGGGTEAYFQARISVDQATNFGPTNHVEFQTEIENDGGGFISLATGSGQANGLITLAAGKKYILTAGFNCEFNAALTNARFKWRNNTAASEFGNVAEVQPDSFTLHFGKTPLCVGILDLVGGVQTEVEVRITQAGLLKILGALNVGETFVLIHEF